MICIANQLTGFYIGVALVLNGLSGGISLKNICCESFQKFLMTWNFTKAWTAALQILSLDFPSFRSSYSVKYRRNVALIVGSSRKTASKSYHWLVFYRIAALRILQNLQENICDGLAHLVKSQTWICNFTEKRAHCRCFLRI